MTAELTTTIKRGIALAVTILITLIFAFPLFWVVISSFKTRLDLFAIPPKWLFTPTLENYRGILASDFVRQFLNSLIIAAASTTISIILGSLTAYGFSRHNIRGSDFLLFWILSLRMLPVIAVVVPFYLLFRTLGLLDTHIALVLVYCIFNISFSVWVLKGFFDEIPLELEEAAMLDGYSPPQVFFRVSLPLARAGLATTAIFCLIQSLNEFLVALALTARAAETAPVGLAKLQTFLGTDWGRISAAATLFMLPVVIFTILVRNELIRGMSFGRMK
ncbi:MAG: carbohydrate ABC transporter permease [Anaerolineae bacterium]|nr:carbohydrate ABC transporter permease [Anaerolineae bacterium]MDW8097853.1 carbohydrate ABC transporter permease [Anaerolineae bacterium]